MIPSIGIHENVPFPVYQSWEALNNSLLKEITRSPGHLAYRRDHSIDVTLAMTLGSATDTLLFDGETAFARAYQSNPQRMEELPSHFVQAPDGYKGTTKADKEWRTDEEARGNVIVKPADWNGGGLSGRSAAGKAWKQWAESQGLSILSRDDIQRVRDTVEAIHHHEHAYTMLHAGQSQLSIVWRDEETGVLCKARLDLYTTGAIIDLKTTVDADPETFAKLAFAFRYHWQAAFYCDGMTAITGEPHDEFSYIVAEREPPHRVEVMRLGMAELEMGRAEYRDALRLYAECEKNNHWPTSSGTVQELRFPGWAFK